MSLSRVETISYFAMKDLPEPGSPKISPLKYFADVREYMIRLPDALLIP